MSCRSSLVAREHYKDSTSIGKSLGSILSSKTTKEMLKNPRYDRIKNDIAAVIIQSIQHVLDARVIQGACDDSGISRKAYTLLFKIVQEAFAHVKIRKLPLPRPFRVKKTRYCLNESMSMLIGEPFHIKKLYTCESGTLEYNESNNLFLDINKVVAYMIKYYKIFEREVQGKLILVIKLDESEIIKGQKLERVSITFMNRALNNTENDADDSSFSVQSENEIWWLAAFQVYFNFT